MYWRVSESLMMMTIPGDFGNTLLYKTRIDTEKKRMINNLQRHPTVSGHTSHQGTPLWSDLKVYFWVGGSRFYKRPRRSWRDHHQIIMFLEKIIKAFPILKIYKANEWMNQACVLYWCSRKQLSHPASATPVKKWVEKLESDTPGLRITILKTTRVKEMLC